MRQLKKKRQIPLNKVFKRLFQQSSHANRVLLACFINAVLRKSLTSPVQDITEHQCQRNYLRDEEVLSIIGKAKTKKDQPLEVIIQVHSQDYVRNPYDRIFGSEHVKDQSSRFIINILNFNLLQESNHYHNCTSANSPNQQAPSEIHYLELSKFTTDKPVSALEQWLYFLINVGERDQSERFQQLIHHNPYFKLAHHLYQRTRLKMHYPVVVKEEQLSLGKLVEQNQLIEKEKIAIKMIKAGFPYQQIIELTEITVEELDKLALTVPLL